MVLGWTLWGIGAAGVLGIALRVATTRHRRAVALPGLLAALLLSTGELLTLRAGSQEGLTTAAWLSGVLGTSLIVAATVVMLRIYLRMDAVHEWLDLASGILLALALVFATVVEPLAGHPGVTEAGAARLVSLPALAVIAMILTVIAFRAVGVLRQPRGLAFTAAVALLLVATSASAIAAGPGGQGATVVHQVALAAALLLLCVTGWTPEPPVVAAFEPVDTVMRSRLVQLVVIGVLLAVDHAVGLPTPGVVLALAAMAVQVVNIALVYRLVTSLRATRHEALTDELTGLGNRRALSRALRTVDGGAPAALMLIDLDRFKEVNDLLGHAAGDDLLRQVAQRLRERSSPLEVLVRQGGDEFALVAADASATQTAARARVIAGRLAEPFLLGGTPVTVAASIGIASAPQHARTAEGLLQKADAAMYAAKEAGAGPQVYDRETDRARLDELALATDLRRAIGTDELVLAFQPQVEVATGHVVGLEALVRWNHPTLGTLGATTFLALAARHGFMEALTTQVLHEALRARRDLQDQEGPLRGARVCVNVSAASLHHTDLVTVVRAALLEHDTPPSALLLEITETELMVDPVVSRRVVGALVDQGVGVSIDDYGTGHSSLAYLRDLPVTELKLDRSFVAALTTDERTADIVRTTVDLAHSLGLRLVAEGVEDQQTLDALVALGADVTQGYLHGEPLSAAMLRSWRPHGAPAPVTTAAGASPAAVG